MTLKHRVLNELLESGNLKEYDAINLDCITFHVRYGTNIVRHNESPTLTTKGGVAFVLGDQYE